MSSYGLDVFVVLVPIGGVMGATVVPQMLV